MPGPPRKKDAERRRRNKDGIETLVINLDEAIAGEVEIPAPPQPYFDDDGKEHDSHCWHYIAEDAYMSLTKSGQAIFMEPSDWSTAYALCEMLSRELNPKPILVQVGEGETEVQWVKQPLNGAVVNAFLKGWASLMATEGDRRRLRIELERKKRIDAAAGGDDKVVDIVAKRADVFKKKARG